MRRTLAVAVAAVLPMIGWAAVFVPAPWWARWLFGFPVVTGLLGGGMCLPEPWHRLRFPAFVWWLAMTWEWLPDVMWDSVGGRPDAAIAGLVLVGTLWWWRALWVAAAPERPATDPHPDVPDPRPIRVGPDSGVSPWAGSGLEVGHGVAEPAPPRVARVSQPVMVDVTVSDDGPAPTGDPVVVLADAVARVWGESPVMHMDELADALDADKQMLTDELREAGAPIDPKARKRRNGQSVPKAGMRRDDFDAWRTTLSTS